ICLWVCVPATFFVKHSPIEYSAISSSDILGRLIFFFTHTAPAGIYTLSLHDALPIFPGTEEAGEEEALHDRQPVEAEQVDRVDRTEEHTSELQSLAYLVYRLLLEKKNRSRCCCGCTASNCGQYVSMHS